MTGKERVLNCIRGKYNEVQPCFDIIRNDSIVEYYTGEKLNYENAGRLVGIAAARALDGTRGFLRVPKSEATEILPDGRKNIVYRWTNWVEPVKYDSSEDYIKAKAEILGGELVTAEDKEIFKSFVDIYYNTQETYLKDNAYFWQLGKYINNAFAQVYEEVGLEEFSYIYADAPGLKLSTW